MLANTIEIHGFLDYCWSRSFRHLLLENIIRDSLLRSCEYIESIDSIGSIEFYETYTESTLVARH